MESHLSGSTVRDFITCVLSFSRACYRLIVSCGPPSIRIIHGTLRGDVLSQAGLLGEETPFKNWGVLLGVEVVGAKKNSTSIYTFPPVNSVKLGKKTVIEVDSVMVRYVFLLPPPGNPQFAQAPPRDVVEPALAKTFKKIRAFPSRPELRSSRSMRRLTTCKDSKVKTRHRSPMHGFLWLPAKNGLELAGKQVRKPVTQRHITLFTMSIKTQIALTYPLYISLVCPPRLISLH